MTNHFPTPRSADSVRAISMLQNPPTPSGSRGLHTTERKQIMLWGAIMMYVQILMCSTCW